MVEALVIMVFALEIWLIWFIDERCKRSYQREVEYWQKYQAQVEEEQVQMGQRWAAEDMRLLARGEQPRGCPRGAPGLTLAVYRDVLKDHAPVPMEMPKWKIAERV